MTRDEALGNNYSQEGLVIATSNGYLFDYIAQWYYTMPKEDLKEVLLAVLGVGIDKCCSDEDELEYGKAICDELECRYFGIDDEEDDFISDSQEGFIFDPQDSVDVINTTLTKGKKYCLLEDVIYSDIDSMEGLFDEEDLDILAKEILDFNYEANEVSIPRGTHMTYLGTDDNGWPTFDIHGFEFDFCGSPFKIKEVK